MKNFDNFFLPVDNLKEASEYYKNILGLKVKFDFSNEGMIAYSVGDEEPAIILKDKKVFKNIKPTIWITVDNVIKEYEKLKNDGVKFLGSPFKIKTGYAAEFEDPFGNRLGIVDYNK